MFISVPLATVPATPAPEAPLINAKPAPLVTTEAFPLQPVLASSGSSTIIQAKTVNPVTIPV